MSEVTMTDQAALKVAITLDTANSDRQFPAYQLSINVVDSDGRGHGYRLMGPKYIGRSRNLRTVELTQRDADEIRAVLDEVFPAASLDKRRAEVLREIASMLEEGLPKDPYGEAEEHVNDCYRTDIMRLRRMAEEGSR